MSPRRTPDTSQPPKKRASKRRAAKKGTSKQRAPKEAELHGQLAQINLHAAGIDLGSRSHFVAVPADRDPHPVREFGAFTADLYRMADWLKQCRIDTVVMESTGVYWTTLMEVLEERGFIVLLVNPHQLKHCPGRKTDVCDAQWLQTLHTFGLLTGAFRPDDQVCVLRSYQRQRSRWIRDAARYVLHMQKALTQMNLHLKNVLNDVTGVSGMRIIQAILEGERDPYVLASLRDGRCRKSVEEIAQALHGHWREEHLFELRMAKEGYDFCQCQVRACDERLEKQLEQFDTRTEDPIPPPKRRQSARAQGNAPAFDVRGHLYRITGVDLTRIDGVDAYSMLQFLSEVGVDLNPWPSDKHFSSWLGLCPGNNVTGGKSRSGRTKPCANRAAAVLRLCASSLHRSASALGAYFRRQKARLGTAGAVTATAHKLARIIYAMLTQGTEYVDIGQDAYERQFRERALINLRRTAQRLGFDLVDREAVYVNDAEAMALAA